MSNTILLIKGGKIEAWGSLKKICGPNGHEFSYNYLKRLKFPFQYKDWWFMKVENDKIQTERNFHPKSTPIKTHKVLEPKSTTEFEILSSIKLNMNIDKWEFKYKGIVYCSSKSKFDCEIEKKRIQKQLNL